MEAPLFSSSKASSITINQKESFSLKIPYRDVMGGLFQSNYLFASEFNPFRGYSSFPFRCCTDASRASSQLFSPHSQLLTSLFLYG